MNNKRLSKPGKVEDLSQTEYFSDTQKSQMIKHFMAQVKTEDLLNVGFMKPIEVALRTSKTDNTVPSGTLPQGLMLALKDNGINDNKFKLTKILPIPPQINSLDELRRNNLDNYISLLKKNKQQSFIRQSVQLQNQRTDRMSQAQSKPKVHNGMELGICISMKSQSKKLLKRSLVGVAQNIDEMIRSGMSPDEIFVVVMIDGVANADKSLFEYIQQFERESEIFIEDDEKLTIKKKYEINQYHQQIEKEQPLNFNKFLFKPEQFTSRIQSKFQNVRQKYDEVVRIKKSIANIKKQNNKDNQNLKMILNKMIDKQKNIMKKIDSNSNVLINQQSIMKQLATSEEECNQYISTRQSLAYVSCYRVPTTSIAIQCKQKQTKFTIQRDSIMESKYFAQRSLDQETLKNQEENSQDDSLTKVVGKKTIRYVNMFFCIKYKEEGKLSSHNWFFNGFCQDLNPRYTVLVDVGVKPYPDSIFKMYRCMKLNDKIGSVCGYMRLLQQKVQDQQMENEQNIDCVSSIFSKIFDIQRSQQVDNHFDHLVEKPFQSIFNFIHALPGSFSGYNMNALRPDGQSTQLMKQYFKTIDDKTATNKVISKTFTPMQMLVRIIFPKFIWKYIYKIDPDSEEQYLYNENVNLAEDRILCLQIHKNNKDIMFMPDVFAKVQPIKMINDYMQQKRIQINGGSFAFDKVRQELTDQNSKRTNFLIRFQLFYFSISNFMSFFAPSILVFAFYFTFQIIQTQFLQSILNSNDPKSIGNVIYATITNIVVFFYALMLGTILFFSLHVDYKHKRFRYYIYLVSTQLGLYSFISFLVYFVQTLLGLIGTNGDYLRRSYYNALVQITPGSALLLVNLLRYFILSSIVVIIFPVLVYSIFFRKGGVLWDIIVGILSTIFYFPTSVALLPIYSKCKIDEIHSGAKSARNLKMKQTWKILKYLEITKYLFWNVIGSFILILLHSYILMKFFALLSFLMFFTILYIIKLIPVLIYTINYKCKMIHNPLLPSQQEIAQRSSNNNLRIFDTIKRFQDDFKTEIQYSFEIAAEEIQYQNAKAQQQIDIPIQNIEKAQQKPKTNRLQSVQFRPSRKSIQIMNHFQGQKFNNIRQSSAVKKNYYPFQFGGGKKQPKMPQPSAAPLQMVLLKQKIGEQAIKNKDLQVGQIKLKQYENFRSTIKPMF